MVALLSIVDVFATTNIISANLGFSPMLAGSKNYKYSEKDVYDSHGYRIIRHDIPPMRFSFDLDLETYFNDGKLTQGQRVGNTRYANPKSFRWGSFSRWNGVVYDKKKTSIKRTSSSRKNGVYHGWHNGINIKVNGDIGHISYATGYVSRQRLADNMDISEILAFQIGYGYDPRYETFNLGLRFDVIYTYYFTKQIGINAGLGLTLNTFFYGYGDKATALYGDNFVGVKFKF